VIHQMKMGFRLMVLVGMMGVLLLIVGATGVRGIVNSPVKWTI